VDWVGLKAKERKKGLAFVFVKRKQTNPIQMQIQRIQILIEQLAIK